MAEERKFAVLIDADNVSDKYVKIVLDKIASEGIATYKRIYGDWTNPTLVAWKATLLENSIIPIQQYSYTSGKNSTDSAMIIDAMDILYSGQVDGFCLVSSDSDFTRLAARLRESAMLVIGMGERKTPKPFIAACNQFKYLDVLWESAQKSAVEKDGRQTPDNAPGTVSETLDETLPVTNLETIKSAIQTIVEEGSDEDGWIFAGKIGGILAKRYPDFDVRNFGYIKMKPFIESLGAYETNVIPKGNIQLIYFRRKKDNIPNISNNEQE